MATAARAAEVRHCPPALIGDASTAAAIAVRRVHVDVEVAAQGSVGPWPHLVRLHHHAAVVADHLAGADYVHRPDPGAQPRHLLPSAPQRRSCFRTGHQYEVTDNSAVTEQGSA